MKPTIMSFQRILQSLAIIAVFVRINSAQGAVYNLQVPVNVPWYDTGINVSAGDQLLISASGSVEYFYANHAMTGPGGTNWDGQQYFSLDVYANTTVVSLIGKIGGTTAVGTGTAVPAGTPGNGVGYVGASYNQIMLAGGRLFLGFNDQYFYPPNGSAYTDNFGSFNVMVTVVPEPSILAMAALGAIVLVRRLRCGTTMNTH